MSKMVFISSQGENREWVKRLRDALLELGFSVWYPHMKIKPGEPFPDDIEDEMREALRGSDYVVFVITPETAHSNWMAAELGAALLLRKTLIAVISKDVPLDDLPEPIKLREHLVKGNPKVVAAKIAQRVESERNGKEKASAGTA